MSTCASNTAVVRSGAGAKAGIRRARLLSGLCCTLLCDFGIIQEGGEEEALKEGTQRENDHSREPRAGVL